MKAKLIETKIAGNVATITLADAQDRETAAVWIQFSAQVERIHEQALQTIQLEALRALRTEVGEQIQAFARTDGPIQ